MATISSVKSDYLGAVASMLCIIHCLATPILFVVQSCTINSCCEGGPLWWSAIDYLFIGITLFAVIQSSRNTSKPFMKYALFGTWIILSFLMINEKMAWLSIAGLWKYLAAAAMVSVHVYNLKFCQCTKEGSCCSPS